MSLTAYEDGVDNDDYLDRNGLADAVYFNEWDDDNDDLLAEDELYEGVYNAWDVDNDDFSKRTRSPRAPTTSGM